MAVETEASQPRRGNVVARRRSARVTSRVTTVAQDNPSSSLAFGLFIVFIVFTLLSVPSRFPVIGIVRPTVLFVAVISGLILFVSGMKSDRDKTRTTRLLTLFALYMLVSIPFVQWPGSVLRHGIEGFVKVVVFFYFAVQLVDTFPRLRLFVATVIGCQVFRVLEPLYLNLTTGYMGSRAHMGGADFMARLSGAPSDIINPNGLAFVVLTALPFLHYLLGGSKRVLAKVAYVALAPMLFYALTLTGSRSGLVGLLLVVGLIVVKSRHRVMLASVAMVGAVLLVGVMSVDMKDRYLSLVDVHTRNVETRQGRIEGVKNEFRVGMNRPLFGFGLGTSREALANFSGKDQIAHNMYTEVFIETGLIGLAFMIVILASVVSNVRAVPPAVTELANVVRQQFGTSVEARLDFYRRCADALLVLLVMFLVFSLASYGLSEFYLYLIAGLSVALRNILNEEVQRFAGK